MKSLYVQFSDSGLTDSRADGLDGSLDAVEQLRQVACGLFVFLLLLQHKTRKRHAVGVKGRSLLGHDEDRSCKELDCV